LTADPVWSKGTMKLPGSRKSANRTVTAMSNGSAGFAILVKKPPGFWTVTVKPAASRLDLTVAACVQPTPVRDPLQ